MQAKGLHIGMVMEEIDRNSFDPILLNKSKKKAKGIKEITFAYYIILRAEDIASKEEFPLRRF
mgnify:FL=1|tara:strand:+ start:378 stop:566 length:189 start_codon:yes stop_codon:yes gene_type:complete